MNNNPFLIQDKKSLPVPTITDYHKDCDDYIIDYYEVEHVKMVGEKDTDFVKSSTIEEYSRTPRQAYLDSQADDVGILNIMKKVALSGDISLLNQTGRVGYPSDDKDSLGRAVEKVVDLTSYQGGTIEALNAYKHGADVYAKLDPELKGKLSMEEVAKLSDEVITSYLQKKISVIEEASKKKEGE